MAISIKSEFRLSHAKSNPKKYFPIKIRVTEDQKSKYISTGLKCDADTWTKTRAYQGPKNPEQKMHLSNILNALQILASEANYMCWNLEKFMKAAQLLRTCFWVISLLHAMLYK